MMTRSIVHWTIFDGCHLPRMYQREPSQNNLQWTIFDQCRPNCAVNYIWPAIFSASSTREKKIHLTSSHILTIKQERKNYISPAPRRALSVERSDGWTEEKHVVENVLDSSSIIFKMLKKTKDEDKPWWNRVMVKSVTCDETVEWGGEPSLGCLVPSPPPLSWFSIYLIVFNILFNLWFSKKNNVF